MQVKYTTVHLFFEEGQALLPLTFDVTFSTGKEKLEMKLFFQINPIQSIDLKTPYFLQLLCNALIPARHMNGQFQLVFVFQVGHFIRGRKRRRHQFQKQEAFLPGHVAVVQELLSVEFPADDK